MALPSKPVPIAKRKRDSIPTATERRSGKNRRTREGELAPQLPAGIKWPTAEERARLADEGADIQRKGFLAAESHKRTNDEMEFLRAVDHYKTDNHRPHPSWSEILGVLKSLRYRRIAEADVRFRMVLSSYPMHQAARRFEKAMCYYMRVKRRPFPTCSETLAVLLALGYRKAVLA